MRDDYSLRTQQGLNTEIEILKTDFDAKTANSTFVEKMDLIRDLSYKLYKVAKKNKIIEIDFTQLKSLIKVISTFENQNNVPITSSNSLDEALAKSLFFSVVNFCFVDPITNTNYTTKSPQGEKKLSLALRYVFDRSNDWSEFEEVSRLKLSTWQDMIQLGTDNHLYQAEKRFENLINLAKYLKINFKTISEMRRYFTDASMLFDYLDKSGLYEDRFKKRLQLLLREWDQHLKMFRQKGLKNISALTGMADYRIPQFLISENIVKVNNSDLVRLQSQTTFREDDHFVLFMRAATILIISEIALAVDMSESTVDAIIWKIAHEKNINSDGIIPAMLVATDQF